MKIFFTTDLHGSKWHYNLLQRLIQQERPDVLLLGGDQCPSAFGEGAIVKQQQWLDKEFRIFLEVIHPICKTVWTSGNHDLSGALSVLEDLQREGLIIQSDYKWTEIGPDYSILGFPFGPATWGWYYKDWERRDGNHKISVSKDFHYFTTMNGEYCEIDANKFFHSQPSLEELLIGLETTPKKSKSLLLTHYPPFNSGLDECLNGPIGSKTISQFIKECNFDAVCSGHAHESPYISKKWVLRFGNTFCINPGQLGGESLNAVIFEAEDIEGTLIHTVFGKPDARVDYAMSKEELRRKLPTKLDPSEFVRKTNFKLFVRRVHSHFKKRKKDETK